MGGRRLLAVLAAFLITAIACAPTGGTATPTPPPVGTPGIVDGPTMRLAGSHTFTFNPSIAGGTISWRLDRETVSESGGTPSRTNGAATATGQTATFSLTKVSGNETNYYVNANDSGASDVQTVQVFPANVRSSFMFKSAGNPNVRTYIIVPGSLSAATHVVMVNHGTDRNADKYCDTWITWSSQNDRIAICPRFDTSGWPGSRGYNLGNVFTGDDGAGTRNPEEKWSFTVAESIGKKTLSEFALTDKLFDMWGHSAGGQFVHRFAIFKPNAPIRFSMPADSGWYTAPDLTIDFPYALQHPLLAYTAADVLDWTREHMIIMRGENDTLRDGDLRTTPEADAQGLNRFERAQYMYSKGVAVNPSLNWQLITVPNADHDQRKMAPAAQDFLKNPNKILPYSCPLPDGDPCQP